MINIISSLIVHFIHELDSGYLLLSPLTFLTFPLSSIFILDQLLPEHITCVVLIGPILEVQKELLGLLLLSIFILLLHTSYGLLPSQHLLDHIFVLILLLLLMVSLSILLLFIVDCNTLSYVHKLEPLGQTICRVHNLESSSYSFHLLCSTLHATSIFHTPNFKHLVDGDYH